MVAVQQVSFSLIAILAVIEHCVSVSLWQVEYHWIVLESIRYAVVVV